MKKNCKSDQLLFKCRDLQTNKAINKLPFTEEDITQITKNVNTNK